MENLIEVTIILPNQNSSWEQFLTSKYGGFTRTNSLGAWSNYDGELETEVVYVYTAAISVEKLYQLRTVAKLEAVAQNQAALYIAVGRIAEIIELQR